MAGPPPQWPFAGVAPPGVAASGAQWFSGFAGEAGTPQNPAGPFAGEGARADAAGASSGGGAGPSAPDPSGSAGASDAGGSAPGARVAKVRKPYTITKQRERWTDDEHERELAQWRRGEKRAFECVDVSRDDDGAVAAPTMVAAATTANGRAGGRLRAEHEQAQRLVQSAKRACCGRPSAAPLKRDGQKVA